MCVDVFVIRFIDVTFSAVINLFFVFALVFSPFLLLFFFVCLFVKHPIFEI